MGQAMTTLLQEPEAGRALPPASGEARTLSAWLYLVWLCLQRQARARQMVWIALALLGLTATVVLLNTLADRWGMYHWRSPRGVGPTYRELVANLSALPYSPGGAAVADALLGTWVALLDRSGFFVFTNWIVFSIFLSFLLPVWSLSFATDAIGGDREAGTLGWLLLGPLPRPAVYLAKFLGMLPYSLGLNLGGFALLCVAAGKAGEPAFGLFWPAVVCGTLAFCSLFHFMGACFRRPAVLAIVYSFFLEMILGNMPGYMKRVSIGFYTRCMMFEKAERFGIQPQKPSIYLPVDGQTAAWVLVGITVVFLVAGMVVFSRSEYRDVN
jgi:hypothetical protein